VCPNDVRAHDAHREDHVRLWIVERAIDDCSNAGDRPIPLERELLGEGRVELVSGEVRDLGSKEREDLRVPLPRSVGDRGDAERFGGGRRDGDHAGEDERYREVGP
jgi:hypothetical protein